MASITFSICTTPGKRLGDAEFMQKDFDLGEVEAFLFFLRDLDFAAADGQFLKLNAEQLRYVRSLLREGLDHVNALENALVFQQGSVSSLDLQSLD